MRQARYLTLAGLHLRDERLHVRLTQEAWEDYRSAYGYRWSCVGCGESQFLAETEKLTRRGAREHATTCTAIPDGWTAPERRCYHPPAV